MDLLATVVARAKQLYELSQKLKDIEIRTVIAGLKSSVLDLQDEVVQLRQEHLRLRAEHEELLKQRRIRPKFELRDGFYELTEPIEGHPAGTYCPVCFEQDRLMIPVRTYTQRLRPSPNRPPKDVIRHRCPRCVKQGRK